MNRQQSPLRVGAALVAVMTLGAQAGPAVAMVTPPAAEQSMAAADTVGITAITLLNPTAAELHLTNGRRMAIDFFAPNIFRLFRDDQGGIVRNPQAVPPADILVKQPRKDVGKLEVSETATTATAATGRLRIDFDKSTGLMSVTDLATGREVISQTEPVTFAKGKTRLSLAERPDEFFYGGGVQNGRFSHKGRSIAIENQNSWTDGGVASPTPFYWSTDGYGIMFHTFGKGKYDFGASTPGQVNLMHESPYLDMFVMVDNEPVSILNDFYQLTGHPVLLPKFGFYEGHLNAYNRDYWAESDNDRGVVFEDGKRYRESQQDNGGVRESLNGENNNYQFSARAVIDRYAAHDMPLGWILPNDGYGAGYGQTSSLDGNIDNLRQFGDYARQHGVEIGLWTQSDLHPKEGVAPLLQRDIVKEVRDAGVRVLKTDVAWVGDGYSFGLNGVADVGEIMPYYGNDARPFIISLDGWAGTQRYAGIWSGDQTGGDWEYIRFHIPTYIGSGLSGQPNITSDMDGIFGGKNPAVNIRDFQWKTFTPMQLNMDGWGANEKYPHALGEPAASINRNYLKLKSELMPYAYTIARDAIDGKPLMRAMFLDYPDNFTHGPATGYQFLYGPSLLVAPIYQATAADSLGNDIRNNIYLPEGQWTDWFNGDTFSGPVVLNSFDAPLWKLPVFVKAGAIIPINNPHNNPSEVNRALRIFEIWPSGQSEFTEYDDDGTTQSYLAGSEASVATLITSDLTDKGVLTVDIHPTTGNFNGFNPDKATELRINCATSPKSVEASIGKSKVKLRAVGSAEELAGTTDAYFFDPAPEFNRFATEGSDFASFSIARAPQLIVKLRSTDTRSNGVKLIVKGVVINRADNLTAAHGPLSAPMAEIADEAVSAYAITPSWSPVENADFYEIEFDGLVYTNIRPTEFTFEGLKPETSYEFKVRAANADGRSEWASVGATTRNNPLEWAIRGIRGEVNVEIQPGFEVSRLFDFAESGDMFHTRYRKNAIPFELIMDLQSVNSLDRFQYLPRTDGGNGTILSGSVAVSLDKEHWTEIDSINWTRSGEVKEFVFNTQPKARYIKLSVDSAVNNYGAGREIYVFKVPGTESYLPGDINNDGRIDSNDLTSYMNYTGLRQGDPDFEGYVSNGDINLNGLIDAYDISVVATRLDDGVEINDYASPLAGTIVLKAESPAAIGDTAVVTIEGVDLSSVNAVSAAVNYDSQVWEYLGVEPVAVADMENLTRNRLHSNGSQAVYPTFVNIGERPDINGSVELLKLKFKRLKRGAAQFTLSDTMLVDKKLNTIK